MSNSTHGNSRPSIVRARDAGHDSEHNKQRREDANRYPDNARDKTCNSLGAAGVPPWLGVDLIFDPATDDNPTDPYEAPDDAAQAQHSAKDAEDQGQSRLRMLCRGRPSAGPWTVRAHAAEAGLVRVRLVGLVRVRFVGIAVARRLSIALDWVAVSRRLGIEARAGNCVGRVGGIAVGTDRPAVRIDGRASVSVFGWIGGPVVSEPIVRSVSGLLVRRCALAGAWVVRAQPIGRTRSFAAERVRLLAFSHGTKCDRYFRSRSASRTELAVVARRGPTPLLSCAHRSLRLALGSRRLPRSAAHSVRIASRSGLALGRHFVPRSVPRH